MKKYLLALIILGSTMNTAFGNEKVGDINYPELASEQPFFNANKAAFITTTSFAFLTIASAMGAATAARVSNTFGIFSYSALAIGGAAASIAAITAWMNLGDNTEASTYFQKVGEHAGIAVAGVFQFTAQVLVMSIVQGLAQGTSRAISRSIGGEDQTIRITR
ncbi:membrane hypothetical protein [Gammaproteobacteria bacterium]